MLAMNRKVIILSISLLLIISARIAFSDVVPTGGGGGGGQLARILTLQEGWNSVSSPFQEGIDVQTINNSCGNYVQVQYWTGTSYGNEYSTLQAGKGYLVLVLNNCSFSVSGTPYTMQPFDPSGGWRLIGASSTDLNVNGILGTCDKNSLQVLTSIDHVPTDILEVSKSYWIMSPTSCTFGKAPVENCTDSDGGKNYFVKGTVTQGAGSSPDCCAVNLGNPDCYETSGYLAERFCDSQGNLNTEIVSCPNLCQNGACLSSPPTCTDSDGGKNYYSKGQAMLSTGANLIDSCPTNSPYKAGITLLEAYCTNESPFVVYQEYNCSKGCKDGACIKETCVNHNECSQACDDLGITSHWSGSKTKSWTGTCPSGAYGCMTGDCCLGQCTTSGTCFCQRTNKVDIYGSVCPSGTTCGQDCYCHSNQTTSVCGNSICDTDEHYCPDDCGWFWAHRANVTRVNYKGTTYLVSVTSDVYVGNVRKVFLNFSWNNGQNSEGFIIGEGESRTLSNGSVIKINGLPVSVDVVNIGIASGPYIRGFSMIQVLPPWSLSASNGALTMNLENRIGGQIKITQWTIDVGNGPVSCDVNPDVFMDPGSQQTVSCTPSSGWIAQTPGQSYNALITIYYSYQDTGFTTTGTLSSTYAGSVVNATCTDSDGGKNYYLQGTITSGTTRLVESCYLFNPSGSGSPVSECPSSDSRCKIHEHWCEGSAIRAEEYKCPYGCKNGACISSTDNSYSITVQASDSSDSYVRDWNIFTYDPTGTYIGNGKWSSGTPLKTAYYTRSGTWSFNLNSGTYYLVIGQSGGEPYGSYSGQINVNGVNMQFTGADINHAIKFDVPLQITTKVCINHDECSQACDNLGISSKWMGYGNNRKFWEGSCPSSVYGCMTGDCCLGQCNSSGRCFCLRTNVVDIYGNVCPTGSTCGDDCRCHQTDEGYKFSVKTDRYSYLLGEDMKITAVLSGKSSTDFSKATVMTNIGNTNVIMNPVGAGSSACTASATGTTCSVSIEYYFVGTYNVPSDTLSGVYKVISTSVLGGDRKNAVTNFQVGTNYNDYVGVSVNPQEQYTMVGNQVKYDVTVTDSHPIMTCPYAPNAENKCNPEIYSYLINVDGLPYHTVFPEVVNVHAGGSNTFELKVFSSPGKTEEGIATTIQSATTSATAERSVSITGNPIATAASAQTTPIKDAVFKFSVKVSLKGDSTVSDSATGILHVRFVELNESPPFQQQEKFNIDLVKGWNLISLPGKGIGFIQGTCSERPLAFVYLKNLEKYISIDEALKSLGSNELLDHLSTHSFWVYSYEDCSIGFKVDSYSTYSGLALTKGWNLLGVTKDMTGETLGNIKGSCTFDKIYTWNKKAQTWVQRSENDLIDESINGMILQTEADCNLKTNMIQPPPFPSG